MEPSSAHSPTPVGTHGFDPETYVRQTVALLALTIPEDQIPGIVTHFERTQIIAQAVLDFPLSDSLDAAPTFEP